MLDGAVASALDRLRGAEPGAGAEAEADFFSLYFFEEGGFIGFRDYRV